MAIKILIIEDDDVILRFLSLALKTNKYEILTSKNGISGINLILSHQPDLILLDLGLPDLDGMKVIEEIRKTSKIPIIVISARDRDKDKIFALDQGANDYITKPFNIDEVLARIRVSLRGLKEIKENEPFIFKALKIDFDKHKVYVNDNEVHLTPIEFKILQLLVQYQGKVLTHKLIQDKVWGYDTVDNYQTLRVFIGSIRKKIETERMSSLIITEVGVGYRFNDE
jgi:two-component system KDP operon response regulator KdpE